MIKNYAQYKGFLQLDVSLKKTKPKGILQLIGYLKKTEPKKGRVYKTYFLFYF